MELKCIDCNKPFEVNRINLLGLDRPLSKLCPDCRNKKIVEAETQEREQLEIEIQNRKKYWLGSCGIPPRYKDKSFDNYKDRGANTEKIKNICVGYADKFPLNISGFNYHSLYLFSEGVWGNGKTHLVCAIAKRIINRWVSLPQESPIYYTTEYDMFRRLRATFNNRNIKEHEYEIYEHMNNVPLLIVDDVGKEEVGDPKFVQRVWFSIINGRYNNILPLVFTSNLNPDGLADHLGANRGNEATFDRLLEMCKGVFWELEGISKRREHIE